MGDGSGGSAHGAWRKLACHYPRPAVRCACSVRDLSSSGLAGDTTVRGYTASNAGSQVTPKPLETVRLVGSGSRGLNPFTTRTP